MYELLLRNELCSVVKKDYYKCIIISLPTKFVNFFHEIDSEELFLKKK